MLGWHTLIFIFSSSDDHNQIDVDRRFFDFLSTNAFFCNSSSAVMQDISVATIEGPKERAGLMEQPSMGKRKPLVFVMLTIGLMDEWD